MFAFTEVVQMNETFLIKIKNIFNKLFSYFLNNKKNTIDEEIFLIQWTQALKHNAVAFNGLYGGLQKIVDGKAKKPESVISEWWTRTRYKWENQPITEISRKYMENADYNKCVNIAKLLLKAAHDADISKENNKEIILDEVSARAYLEWNGKEIFPSDKVKIITPAWYQYNHVIEQGHCEILEKSNI